MLCRTYKFASVLFICLFLLAGNLQNAWGLGLVVLSTVYELLHPLCWRRVVPHWHGKKEATSFLACAMYVELRNTHVLWIWSQIAMMLAMCQSSLLSQPANRHDYLFEHAWLRSWLGCSSALYIWNFFGNEFPSSPLLHITPWIFFKSWHCYNHHYHYGGG